MSSGWLRETDTLKVISFGQVTQATYLRSLHSLNNMCHQLTSILEMLPSSVLDFWLHSKEISIEGIPEDLLIQCHLEMNSIVDDQMSHGWTGLPHAYQYLIYSKPSLEIYKWSLDEKYNCILTVWCGRAKYVAINVNERPR